MMRAAAITVLGDLDAIAVVSVPEPSPPGAGEVLVDVATAGIALPDLLMARGTYQGVEQILPQPISIEFAGTVAAIGDAVTRVAVGDRVCAMVFPPKGGASERVVVPENELAKVPDSLTLEQAAAVPSAYMTAEVALHRMGNLQEGERVLVLAGASGVGLAAIQLAVLAGAEVYAAASPAKHAAVRDVGATEVFDYTNDGWEEGAPAMDLILDPIGGASFTRSYALLRVGGRLAVLDAISRHPQEAGAPFRRQADDFVVEPIQLLLDGKAVLGADMPLFWEVDGGQAVLLDLALSYFADTDLRPAVARTFALEEAADALRYVDERRNVGRVVLKVRTGG